MFKFAPALLMAVAANAQLEEAQTGGLRVVEINLDNEAVASWAEDYDQQYSELNAEWEYLLEWLEYDVNDYLTWAEELVQWEIEINQDMLGQAADYLGTAVTVDGVPLGWIIEDAQWQEEMPQAGDFYTFLDLKNVESIVKKNMAKKGKTASTMIVRSDIHKHANLMRQYHERTAAVKNKVLVDKEALEAIDRQIEGLIVGAVDEIGATVVPILEEAGAEEWLASKAEVYEQLAEQQRQAVDAQI